MNELHAAPRLLSASRLLTLAAIVGLILLYCAQSLLQETINWTVLLVPCVTLAVFLPGITKNQTRSHEWLCFVVLLHFTVGVSNAMSPTGAWNDYLQITLSVIIFVGAMLTSRWLKAWHHTSSSPAL